VTGREPAVLVSSTVKPLRERGEMSELKADKITDAIIISNLYRKIISKPEPSNPTSQEGDNARNDKINELLGLFSEIELTKDNSSLYYGILMSIQDYARYLSSAKYPRSGEVSDKAEKIVRKENKHFIMFNHSEGKTPFYTTTGWTQPEFIYPTSLSRMGVTENYINGNSVYDFYELLPVMTMLYERYGTLTKSFDSGTEKRITAYGDEFFSYLFRSDGIITDDHSEIVVKHPGWNSFIEKILPILKDHSNRAQAYYYTKQFDLALNEALLAKEERLKKRPYYENAAEWEKSLWENALIFAIKTELLLQKNPKLRYGLPNKKLPTGWVIPSKLRQPEERSVVVDINQDGILDEAILLCQKEGTTFYNTNLVLHLFLGRPDGSYIIQKVVNNLVEPKYGKLKSISLHCKGWSYANQPANGIVAVFSQKDFDPDDIEEVCISWNLQKQRAFYDFFYDTHD
jgi:hypothetical protein